MRPRKFYAVAQYGRIIYIAHGLADTRRYPESIAVLAFTTQLAAEEYAAWHNYARDLRDEQRSAPRNKPLPATTVL